jgi:hypothetical protein
LRASRLPVCQLLVHFPFLTALTGDGCEKLSRLPINFSGAAARTERVNLFCDIVKMFLDGSNFASRLGRFPLFRLTLLGMLRPARQKRAPYLSQKG